MGFKLNYLVFNFKDGNSPWKRWKSKKFSITIRRQHNGESLTENSNSCNTELSNSDKILDLVPYKNVIRLSFRVSLQRRILLARWHMALLLFICNVTFVPNICVASCTFIIRPHDSSHQAAHKYCLGWVVVHLGFNSFCNEPITPELWPLT